MITPKIAEIFLTNVPNETQYKVLYQFFFYFDKVWSSSSLWEEHALTQIGG